MIQEINIGNYTVHLNWDVIFESMKIDLIEELVRRAPKHDGQLQQSINLSNCKTQKDSLLLYMIDYALFVEFGTLPHWTSVKNLKKWAKDKLGKKWAKDKLGKKWAKDKLGDEKLAYALQRHIALFGTKPHPFIRETLQQEFSKILAKALKEEDAVEVYQN
jgi:hypothetical protein